MQIQGNKVQPASVKDIPESFSCALAPPLRIEWVKGSWAQQDAAELWERCELPGEVRGRAALCGTSSGDLAPARSPIGTADSRGFGSIFVE